MFITFSLLSPSIGMAAVAPKVKQDAQTLKLNEPVERQLAGGQVHLYAIALEAGQLFRASVDQRGIDVVVTVTGPDGKTVVEIDSPNGIQGPEPVSIVSESAGAYRLQVRSLEQAAPAGRYEIRVTELRAATTQDRSRVTAERLMNEATALMSKADAAGIAKALENYQTIIALWREAGDRKQEANALNIAGRLYQATGQAKKALEYYEQALPIMREVGDRAGEAQALANRGMAQYVLTDHESAVKSFNEALPIWRSLANKQGEAQSLAGLGEIYAVTGQMQRSQEHFNQALPLFREIGDKRGEAETITNLGYVYDQTGEKQKSIEFYTQAIAAFRAIGDRSGEAYALTNMGALYQSLGENRKALEYYEQAIPLRKAVGDRIGEAYTYNNMGTVLVALGERQRAVDAYNLALPLFREIGDKRGEGTTLHNISFIYNQMGQRERALEFYAQALAVRRASGDRVGEARTLTNMGEVHELLGEKAKALDYFEQALAFSRSVTDRNNQANLLHKIARVERDRGNLVEARKRIEDALEIVESLRSVVVDEQLRATYFGTMRGAYELYIDILMRLDRSRPNEGFSAAALEASESAIARSLLETLAEARAGIREGADPALVERERTLEKQLTLKAQSQIKMLTGQHSKEQAEALSKEITELTNELKSVQSQIRSQSPRYAALTQPVPLKVEEIQRQILDPNTMLLEYSLGDDRSYMWAVTQTSITAYELPKREEVEAVARSFYRLLTAPNEQQRSAQSRGLRIVKARSSDANLEQTAEKLSRLLLAPVAAQLGGKRLLIVADGALQYIPFAALPAPARAGSAANGLKPLVVDHEIINLPSASTLAVLRRETAGRAPAPKTLAVLADPVFDRHDERVKVKAADTKTDPVKDAERGLKLKLEKSAADIGVDSEGLGLVRLPGTRREAEKILALAPPANRKGVLDFAASRAVATSAELGDYRLVHFATHGFLNSLHPELSGIILSMVDPQGAPQDGFLLAHEIYNMKLGAEMVVLSACQTGLGKEIKGEGLVGLTRGFMYAGARRVVVSLWSVDDDATAQLMANLYRGMLKEGLRPAAALRAAQIEMWKQKRWQAPYYWAAFILQGEWS